MQEGDHRKLGAEEMGNGEFQNPSEGPKPLALVDASSREGQECNVNQNIIGETTDMTTIFF